MPWLLYIILGNFGVNIQQPNIIFPVRQVSIRIESLQIITAISTHFQYLIEYLDLIATTLLIGINDPQEEIQIYSSKCLDSLSHEMNSYLQCSLENIEKCKQFWLIILPDAVNKIQSSSSNQIIKTTLCDFFSNIGVKIFESLDHTVQMRLVNFFSGLSCNEEPTVRSASVRILAVYALFPSMREDWCFVENTAELILPLMKETNLFVRIRACWSLANISESLLTNCKSDYDRISDIILEKLLQSSMKSTLDNDKVRSNAVRTLGNLLCLILPKHLNILSWKRLTVCCIERLVTSIKSGNNSKVKWNACYAIGRFITNRHLFISDPDFNWQKNVFDTLCFITINNVNFKVRINASAALQKIHDRNLYGEYFIPIWRSLILALENSDNLIDFSEYSHRDNLQEQLCFCICHFLDLADEINLCIMSEELQLKKDLIKSIWTKVLNRIVPESAGKLLSTAAMLHNLSRTNKKFKMLSICFSEQINAM